MARKSTKAEIERRVTEVAELLLHRVPRRGIQQHAAKQGWGDNVRCIDTYIARATERIRALGRADLELELGKAKGGYELIFAKAMAKGDLRAARSALDQLVALLGLAAPKRHQLSGPEGGPIELAEAARQARERIASELARLSARQGEEDARARARESDSPAD